MKIPNNYLPIMPYLIVSDGMRFLEFTKIVFAATEQLITRRDDGSLRHGEIRIGDGVVMFGEASEQWGIKPAGMFVYVENVDTVYNAGIHNHAISLMAPMTQEYGYTAGFEDPFGNHWWIVQGEN